MGKRVLRGRTILLPGTPDSDVDETPIKKVRKPRKKREPFPFEDLPSEFYDIVLEKMPRDDFEVFNFGSKFTARICEDFDFSNGFPLEELPVDLYSTIVEKLMFKELIMFNFASRLTKEMCEQLREIEAPVWKISIREESESLYSWNTTHVNLDQVPEKIRLRTKRLTIEKKDVTAIEKYKIKAKYVSFDGDTGTDPEFVKEVIMLTRPEEIYFDSTSIDTLKLEELKKMETVTFIPWNNFGDRDLLAIDLESFKVAVRSRDTPPSVTSEGILRLLQEWRAGTRRIKEINIMRCDLDKQLILNEFPGHPQGLSDRLILCKGDGETDCIVEYYGWRSPVTLVVRECEGVGKAYSPKRVGTTSVCGGARIKRRGAHARMFNR